VGILLSTLSGLNRNRLLTVKPALIFFSVNAIFLAGLYKEVKCSVLIVFTPPCSSLEQYSFILEPFPKCSGFEETLIVAIKLEGTAKAAIGGVIKTTDSIINYSLFSITK
jgi:hypothetical protein